MAKIDEDTFHARAPSRAKRTVYANLMCMNGPDGTAEIGASSSLAQLLSQIQAQNREAFGTFYDATVQRIFALALRITGQYELAEEVVGDVYLHVWQQADTYSPDRGKVIAWLCILCRSRALDALRRDNTAVRKASVGQEFIVEAEGSSGPPDLLLSVEQGSTIHAALGNLSDLQRQLVSLAYFRGYTHKELAALMDLPIGTVKTHLHRAVLKLKDIMGVGQGLYGDST